MAIKFCSINLAKDLMPVREEYTDFMKYFNLTVQSIAYDMGGNLGKLVPEESVEIWN